jgi:hypothetical protein
MTIFRARAADDFATIRARLDELRQRPYAPTREAPIDGGPRERREWPHLARCSLLGTWAGQTSAVSNTPAHLFSGCSPV